MSKVGMTGTRKGMTLAQLETLEFHLRSNTPHEWHDGDCIGADEQANRLMWSIANQGGMNVRMIGHPCNLANQRAYNDYDEVREVKPPLVRNRDIVSEVDRMYAMPFEYEEVFRGSGTWATIRYAKAQGVELFVIWPDGEQSVYNGA